MSRRIALVVGTSTGGVGRHVRSLAEGLRERGHRVVVVGPASADRAFGFTEAGLRFAPVPIGAAPSVGDPAVVLRLGPLVAGADVVHAHGMRAGALCALAGVSPLVVTAHNAPPSVGGPLSAAYPVLERIVARRADVALGVSGDLVRRLRAAGARRARMAVVSAPPVGEPLIGREATRADLAVRPERPLVLTIGRLVGQKGLDTLLAAAPSIADRRPEPVVAIAGDGPLWGALHDTAAELKADVRMLGHRTDVADLLAAADLFCLPSRWEGPSLVIMEALRAGLPVVATRVGGIPDLYGGTVRMVAPDDPRGLAAEVGRVLDDPDLAEELRSRARRAAEALPTEEDAVAAADGVYAAVARRWSAARGPSW
ncbi:glycosyl transferase [Nocardiopsis sp. CNR-923]|uniref:glycosyltransferase family 4 protein n=1 Tax=Nocardiopsis sp. CNR-923 TaxID=1904965 RepID=UPI00095A7A9E|nr:glycosyltransferase family 4 protein [Nocardiopsis sp. CNR-923]OLT30312.1 glycosyl transferase [Nocardiopsis sp. CNR-923]